MAFATNGMAEAALIKAGAAKSGLDLSEQWLVDCKPIGALGKILKPCGLPMCKNVPNMSKYVQKHRRMSKNV